MILTSNLPFSEWTTVFSNPRLCKAVVERLTFRSHTISTGTKSWRFSQALKNSRSTASKASTDA